MVAMMVMTVHITQQEVEDWKQFNEKIPKKEIRIDVEYIHFQYPRKRPNEQSECELEQLTD